MLTALDFPPACNRPPTARRFCRKGCHTHYLGLCFIARLSAGTSAALHSAETWSWPREPMVCVAIWQRGGGGAAFCFLRSAFCFLRLLSAFRLQSDDRQQWSWWSCHWVSVSLSLFSPLSRTPVRVRKKRALPKKKNRILLDVSL